MKISAYHVADVGEPLVAQEIVEDVKRRNASHVVLEGQEPERSRLRRRLFRHGSASADERRSAGKAGGRDRKAGLEEMTSILHVRVPLPREGVFSRGDQWVDTDPRRSGRGWIAAAFPSVFASIGRLTQGQHNKWTVDC